MSEQAIELKGAGFTLSVLQILSHDLSEIKSQLSEKIAQVPQFFHKAPVVLDLQTVENFNDFSGLKALVNDLNMMPIGVTGCPTEYKQAANDAGLAFMSSARTAPKTEVAKSAATEPETANVERIIEKTVKVTEAVPTRVIKQNLRSGQQIYAKDSDLIVLGAVSNGAEVIADGNIHIYGALRGRAIAGASGRDDVSIFSRKLQAELVSVNGHYWTSDKLQGNWEKSVQISLSEDKLQITQLEN